MEANLKSAPMEMSMGILCIAAAVVLFVLFPVYFILCIPSFIRKFYL